MDLWRLIHPCLTDTNPLMSDEKLRGAIISSPKIYCDESNEKRENLVLPLIINVYEKVLPPGIEHVGRL